MTMNRDKPDDIPRAEQAVAALVALAREAFSGEQPGGSEAAGLVAFESAVARRTLRRRAGALPWLVGMGAVATVMVLSVLTFHDRPRPITFSVVNGTVSNGGYVRANVSGGTALHFSDGSSLALDPGAGARVGDFDTHGGRVLLESGGARIHVNPRPRANWTVDAGPYSVHVIGTEFDIRWATSDEVLDLHLLKGAIVVRGPLARDGISMEAGAHLFANVRKGEIRLDGQPSTSMVGESAMDPGAGATAAREAPPTANLNPGTNASVAGAGGDGSGAEVAVAGAAGVAGSSVGAGAHATRPSSAATTPRRRLMALASSRGATQDTAWGTRLGHGDFQGVLSDAERRGLDNVFATASATDLTVLADAARFARRGEVARAALLAERSRFPGSLQGREAAFFLGGLSEDESGEAALEAALDWYECYLRESPHGGFVRPVLGRKMVLVQKLRGSAAARPIAAEYLQRFSDGPYAASARKLLEVH
jgi:FecR protein